MRCWLVLTLIACGPECPVLADANDAGCEAVYDVAFDAGKSEAHDCIPAHEPDPTKADPACKDTPADVALAYQEGWDFCWGDAWFEGYAAEGTTGCSGYQ